MDFKMIAYFQIILVYYHSAVYVYIFTANCKLISMQRFGNPVSLKFSISKFFEQRIRLEVCLLNKYDERKRWKLCFINEKSGSASFAESCEFFLPMSNR